MELQDTPQLYQGRVTLFLSSEWCVKRAHDPTLGWYKMAQEVDVHLIPGEHLNCITKYAQILAATLRTCLAQIQADD
jgi:hypothetical protein